MRDPHGYALWVDPTGDLPVKERDSFVCRHCQSVIIVEPRQDPTSLGGMCGNCWSLICGECVEKGVCLPWEKQIELLEQRDRTRRSLGL